MSVQEEIKQEVQEEVEFEMEELISYISTNAGVEKEVIQKVFDSEEEFMREKGIIE